MDSDPNEFVYDMKFAGQQSIMLSPWAFPSLVGGYSVAIYQQAFDENSNTFFHDILTVENKAGKWTKFGETGEKFLVKAKNVQNKAKGILAKVTEYFKKDN